MDHINQAPERIEKFGAAPNNTLLHFVKMIVVHFIFLICRKANDVYSNSVTLFKSCGTGSTGTGLRFVTKWKNKGKFSLEKDA